MRYFESQLFYSTAIFMDRISLGLVGAIGGRNFVNGSFSQRAHSMVRLRTQELLI